MIASPSDFVARNEALTIDELGSILTVYINRYEPKILSKMLGYQLYKEFSAGIEVTTPDQKWLDLRDGADYTYNGILKRFDGLKDASINYVYFKYSKENQDNNSSIGIKTTVSENSEQADPSYKQMYAYNDIVDINCQLSEFISAKNSDAADTYENYIQAFLTKLTRFNF